MTLVVCRIDGDDLFVHSDTKLTDNMGFGIERQLRQRLPLAGTLKTIFLHRQVCLSFAGQSAFVTQFLKDFMESRISDWTTSRLINVLQNIHRSSQHECEFLVCTAFDRKPLITTIKDGNTDQNVFSAWLGSKEGFEAYQRAYHASKNVCVNLRMAEAFRAVIDNEKIPEVGHFHIQAYVDHQASGVRDESVFLYECEHESDSGSEVQHIAANTRKQLTMGDAAHGAYGTSYFRSFSPKFHGVAIHFPHARLGVLWCPQIDCERAIVLRDIAPRPFLRAIWERFRLPMEGVTIEGNAIRAVKNYPES